MDIPTDHPLNLLIISIGERNEGQSTTDDVIGLHRVEMDEDQVVHSPSPGTVQMLDFLIRDNMVKGVATDTMT